jgi:AcrR family transcriptional regulator
MSHIERKLREKEIVKQSILDAAIKIAEKEGWQMVTIRKIADEIEYTPPIVYEYFQGKEDLFRELVYMGFRIMQQGLADFDITGCDPKEFLMRLSVNHWDFAVKHSTLYQLMFSLERPSPNEEMSAGLQLIKSKILQLTNNEERIHEILFTWMCLVNGSVSFLLFSKFPKQTKMHAMTEDGFTFYQKIIKRFIDTL